MNKLFRVLLFVSLLVPGIVFAQGGRITSDPFAINGSGRPVAGASVAVCSPIATTAAVANGTLLTFTMASNPQTAGFVAGMTVLVQGFTGGDTGFNAGSWSGYVIVNGYTILSVSPTAVVVGTTLTRVASSNGTLLQMGNATTSCAGLAQLYTDASLSTTTTNPIKTDGLGNYGAGIAAGVYYVQIYGPGVTTSLRQIVTTNPNNFPGGINTGQIAFGLSLNTFTGSNNFQYLPASGGIVITTSNVGPTNVPGAGIAFINSLASGGTTAYIAKDSFNGFCIRNDGAITASHGLMCWDGNYVMTLEGGSNSPLLTFYTGTSIAPWGVGSAVLGINTTGSGPHVFAINNTGTGSGAMAFDIYAGLITFYGNTSGLAGIGINVAAGSPCNLILPTISATVGQSLVSAAPSGGNCQTTWTNSPLAASLVTTAATTDNVTVTGMTASGHCTMTATNAAASGLAAVPYISNKTTNQITVTHSVTANANFDILCTPY